MQHAPATTPGSSTPPTPSCCCGSNKAPAGDARPGPIAGTFELIDHFGLAVSERSYGDRHLLVFFGFTHCAVVCPRELAKLGHVLTLLGPLAARVQPLYITVDPARDDPATMRRFLARFPGDFVGLTGSAEQVEAAKKSYRIFAAPVDDPTAPDGYVVPHTAFSYLMGPGGRYETHFPEIRNAETIAGSIRARLEQGVPAL
ncbi:SCO family protein [Variovorax sp. YR216]|uniref:SCO family protein n=1 Tax=Variovorax sp. YR216 TaxID=1882828 RepID=UPI00089BE6C6|nr:SCO family protein [Variovorax sp. YR216]SEB25970.1 protein SCO1/2 [Variovorax sp. YR216]